MLFFEGFVLNLGRALDGQFRIGIFYAILAGSLWGISPLFLKKGMMYSDVSTATLIQQCTNVLTLIGIGVVEGEML